MSKLQKCQDKECKPKQPCKKCVRARKNRQKRIERNKLKKELWVLCRNIIRKRDGDVCFICGQRNLRGSNWHTGHFIPSKSCGGYLRYDLRNLFSSCYNCNINLGGNGAMFYARIVQEYGQDFVDGIFRDREREVKLDIAFFEAKIVEYEGVLGLDREGLIKLLR